MSGYARLWGAVVLASLMGVASARPALARAEGGPRRAHAPALAMDRVIAAVPTRIDLFTALDPDPALIARALQLRHALGESDGARALIDGVLGDRRGFWPALIERSDLRAVTEPGWGGCP